LDGGYYGVAVEKVLKAITEHHRTFADPQMRDTPLAN